MFNGGAIMKKFMWGGSISAHQSEGGYQEGGKGPAIMDYVSFGSHQQMRQVYDEIKEDYDDLVDLIVPPSGEKTSSLASTVVDITSSIKLLRQGAISLEDIEKVITSE